MTSSVKLSLAVASPGESSCAGCGGGTGVHPMQFPGRSAGGGRYSDGEPLPTPKMSAGMCLMCVEMRDVAVT